MSKKEHSPSFSVSVIIPAYNAERYIGRTLDSVLAQSRAVQEIIVVDDGSTDKTKEIVTRYGPPVHYIYQENAGVSAARNTGIKASAGEWVAFLDADDEWHEDNLEKQMALLERNPQLLWTTANHILCYCNENRRKQRLDSEEGTALLKGKEYFEDYFDAFIHHAAGWTGTMIIKRKIIEEAGWFRLGDHLGEDLDMWWRIGHRWPKIGYNSEPLATYHSDIPESSSKRYKEPEIIIDLISRHLEYAAQWGRVEQFLPCARHMLRRWVHECLFDERVEKIHDIIIRFDKILPPAYVSTMRLLTIWPRATHTCMPVLSWINKFLRLPL